MGMVGKIGCRYWGAFAAVYKCVDKWKPRQRRKSINPQSFRFLQAKQAITLQMARRNAKAERGQRTKYYFEKGEEGFKEPLENAIAALTNLLKYRPYDRSVRLKRSALWKILHNRQNALIDALIYFCIELSKDCLDVQLDDINRAFSNDLKYLINEECNRIDSYAQSLKPFLTQDFINLWLSCDCDDPLVEDIWNVRNEQRGTLPDHIAPLKEGQYKEALKALSNGELSSVMKILEKASINGNYRLEATLLLALAHTRNDGATVDKFLDRFERIWDQKPSGYNLRRCKQLVVRYISISRAIRYNPFSGKKMENETKDAEANLYLQEALIIFWKRQNSDIGEVFWKKELKNDNRRKLQHIQKLCDLALKAKPDFHAAKILKLRSILELQMAISISVADNENLKPLENIVNKTNEITQAYNAFGDLCLYSIYLANSKIDKAKLCCERMLDALFFGGQPLSFIIRCDWNADKMKTLKRLKILVAKEPENYVAHILMYYYHFKHDELNCAFEHIDCVLKFWPYHMTTNNLLVYIRAYVQCRLLQTVQKEMDTAVEASFRMMSCSLPALGNLCKGQDNEVNTNESKKVVEIPGKSSQEFCEMEQFYLKLDAVAQQKPAMSEILAEKDQEPKICGTETTSTSNFISLLFLSNSKKTDHIATFDEKAENAGRIIGAAFYYAEQLRREIEQGSRVEKDKHRSDDINDTKDSLKQTLKSEKMVVCNEKKTRNGVMRSIN
ncbi:unnamed protein product [Litomosoides sigmodontis]|uniref:Uncharacterized protein n=1 Tax=Litomosoides sigmodontis TaxID=42156 RepID=A0A3P6T4L0_LITSI|nr:unnamed protein product [Litomosoides sigmodontis]